TSGVVLMRAALLSLLIATGLGTLSACGELFDNELQRAVDYHLDRPRVPAVLLTSDVVDHESALGIDALILADDEPVAVEVAVCGLRDDVPVSVDRVACFDNPALVTVIATRLPARWMPPDLSGLDCAAE